jgi:hypothetical protein
VADANEISVAVSGSEVTRTGTVHSWAERDLASTSAWGTPGVREVVDKLTLVYGNWDESLQQLEGFDFWRAGFRLNSGVMLAAERATRTASVVSAMRRHEEPAILP